MALNMYRPVIGCIFLSACLAACGTLSGTIIDDPAQPRLHPIDASRLQEEVDVLAQPLIDRGVTPGLIVGILRSDHTRHFFGYGVADKTSGIKPDENTVFPIGSLSKGFLGAITASLVKERELNWNDRLDKLLPTETHLSPDAKSITLLELATHTSGLPRQPNDLPTFSRFLEYLFTGENFYRHLDREYVMHYLDAYEAPRQPRDMQYSNVGYGLLGDMLERRTGLTLDKLLEQRILKPLHLQNTGYMREMGLAQPNRARGYAGDQPKFISRGVPVPDWQFTDFMKGSAAMYSTANDLLTFASACIQRRYDKPGVTHMLAPLINRSVRAPAIGWVVDDFGDQQIAYQIGLVAGYTAYIGLDAANQNAVVVLQNSFNWEDRIGHRLLMRMAHAKHDAAYYITRK